MAKSKKKMSKLQARYDELYEHMLDIQSTNEQYLEELRYLRAYIEWKNLVDEYVYFKKNAYEKYDEDLPFPTLTL